MVVHNTTDAVWSGCPLTKENYMKLGTPAQVAKGAKFLDKKLPGWAGKINTKKIVMSSNDMCIMGQLAKKAKAGDALDYAETLGLDEKKLMSHGFEADSDPDDDADAQHAELWRAEIEERLADTAAPVVQKIGRGLRTTQAAPLPNKQPKAKK